MMRIRSRNILSMVLVAAILFGTGIFVKVDSRATDAQDDRLDKFRVAWDFENGVMAPFRITAGQFGEILISSFRETREGHKPNRKEGNYFLSTAETDGTFEGQNPAFTGTISSPRFCLVKPEITLLLAGEACEKNYVAVSRISDGKELARTTVPDGDGVFRAVTLRLPESALAQDIVCLTITDGSPSGYIAVDGVVFYGSVIPETYTDFTWSFEDGTTAPFTTNDVWGKPIVDRDVDRNDGVTPINKDGKYYMSTVEVEDPNSYNEGFVGSFRSPNFLLDPAHPTVMFRVAGGASPANYVALCDAETDRELAKQSPPVSGHPMHVCSVTYPDYREGQKVYLKIVDGLTAGWGFITVDDFRFKGYITSLDYRYEDVKWSFEDGTSLPFTTSDEWGKPIIDRDVDRNDGRTPINKHGRYYMSTVEVEDPNSYNESYVGSFRSPTFVLNPDKPTIRFRAAGGADPRNYVALCDAETGEELVKQSPPVTGHPMQECEMTVKSYKEGQKVYLKIVDGTTSGFAFITVDDFRLSLAMAGGETLDLETLGKLTGWTEERFTGLTAMVQDLSMSYGEKYPNGETHMQAILTMKAKLQKMADSGMDKNDPKIQRFTEDMAMIEQACILENPLITAAPIAFVTRHQYRMSHHNTHTMFPSYGGEIDAKENFTPGGALKVIDFSQGGQVTTLDENAQGVFRDPDVSYDGNQLLLSCRKNRNEAYHIFELTLNPEKNAIADRKQLTSMSTADDMDPLYLPSGQIAFSSTRDPKYVMCNRHIAGNLYRMEADGANVIKITSSTLFERPTDVLPDGRILYDRWEYNDRDFGSAQGLWTVGTDGTQQVTYYGNNSPTGAYIDGKVIPGTDCVLMVLSSTHDRPWGGLAILDRNYGVDGQSPIRQTWPAYLKDCIGDPNHAITDIDAFKGLSRKYEDPQPLSDHYFLASATIPGKGEKTGLYLLDIYGNETLLYEDDSDLGVYDATVLAPRGKELVMTERRNYKDGTGSFFVQDVYQGTHMQGVERGSVTTLRIVESVEKKYISPAQQWGAQGQQNPGVNWHSFEAKRVIGEVPVYADGSAYFEVPQDVFVYFQLLDKDGRMIQSMRSGTLVQSGEKTGCVGCHEDRRTTPLTAMGGDSPMALKENVHIVDNPAYTEGSDLPKTILINTPDVPMKRLFDPATGTEKLVSWKDENVFPSYTDLPIMNFLTDVQPIFTRSCIACHGYENPQAGLTLVPDKDVIFNAAYISLWRSRPNQPANVPFRNMVGVIGGGDGSFTMAKSWGSYVSPLVRQVFENPTHRDRLNPAEKRAVAEWVDLNATYYGDYCSNYTYNPGGRSPLTEAERQAIGDTRPLSWGSQMQPMIFFDNPEKSPILHGKSGAEYTRILSIIRKGQKRLAAVPDVDWKGLTAMPGNPSMPIQPWKMNDMDRWRTEKVALRDAIEAANRKAIDEGKKRYDWDNTRENGLPDWNGRFPGWPTEQHPMT